MVQPGISQGTIKNIMISLLVVGIIITAGEGMIFLFQDVNPNFIDPGKYTSFNDSFNRQNIVNAKVAALQNDVGNQTSSENTGLWNTGIAAATGVAMGFVNSFSFIQDMLLGWSTTFGIPAWIIVAVFGIITLSIVFSVISIFFYREL